MSLRKVLAITSAVAAITGGGVATASQVQAAPSGVTCAGHSPVTSMNATTYGDRLIQAWGAGNTFRTACYANQAVRNTLWSISDTGGAHWRRTATSGAAGTIYLTYHDDLHGGNLTIGVQNVGLRGAGGWHAAYTIKTSNVWHGDRADAAIRAWGSGDRTATSYFATPSVTKALFAHRNPGGRYWREVAREGAAGHVYVTYRYGHTSNYVRVGAINPGVSGSYAHDVDQVKFG